MIVSKIYHDAMLGYADNDDFYENRQVVILTKDEAKTLVLFLSTQWLDRHVPYLSDALDRLQISIKE